MIIGDTAPLDTPGDYWEFWDAALADARSHPLDIRGETVDTGLATVEVRDFAFAGADGRRVTGWLRLPRHRTGPLPAVVHANGYGAGRLNAIDDLVWSAAGYVHLIVNTHEQGGGSTGHILDGILDPHNYYYRGAFVDAVRAVEAVRQLAEVDPSRVAMIGNSQGGGIALGVGALVPDVVAVLAQSPFLTDAPFALEHAVSGPWTEVRGFLADHPEQTDAVMRTLAYVDGVTSARHAVAPGWISAGLIDDICPPQTAAAAAAAYSAPVAYREWPGAGHESGGTADRIAALAVLRERFALEHATTPAPSLPRG
ncbi:acetylxylan esterase [Humibacter ginsengisoli]